MNKDQTYLGIGSWVTYRKKSNWIEIIKKKHIVLFQVSFSTRDREKWFDTKQGSWSSDEQAWTDFRWFAK